MPTLLTVWTLLAIPPTTLQNTADKATAGYSVTATAAAACNAVAASVAAAGNAVDITRDMITTDIAVAALIFVINPGR